jgi:hypothetical protein
VAQAARIYLPALAAVQLGFAFVPDAEGDAGNGGKHDSGTNRLRQRVDTVRSTLFQYDCTRIHVE